MRAAAGLISFVGAGPGAADLLTLRGAHRLAAADVVVWASSLVPAEVLEHCRSGVELHDSAGMTLEDVLAVYRAHPDAAIVRLHSGDVSLYSTLSEQLAWCRRHDRPFEIVPGVGSLAAAAAAAEIELTVPGVAQSAVLTRLGGGRTSASMPDTETVAGFAQHGTTMAIYLSAGRPAALRRELLAGYPPETPAVIVAKASWPDETVITTTVDGLAEALATSRIRTAALVLVGPALSVTGSRSLLYQPSYSHGCRRRSTPGSTSGRPIPPSKRRVRRELDATDVGVATKVDGVEFTTPGTLSVVGLGPGGTAHRTRAAEEAVRNAQVVLGYRAYLSACADLTGPSQRVLPSDIGAERDRAEEAVRTAAGGARVALVSSGDAGIYGMASLALAAAAALPAAQRPAVQVVPGVTAAVAAAALLGAPLARDFACLTLSDVLAPWEVVETRLRAVAAADLVVALYNPRSPARPWQLSRAREVLAGYRPGDTPVGLVTDAGRDGERVELTTLAALDPAGAGMHTVVIVGGTSTTRLGDWLVTARSLGAPQ